MIIVVALLEQRVVGDHVDQTQFAHLLQELLCALQVACLDANVQDAVESRGVGSHVVRTQPLDNGEGAVDITITSTTKSEENAINLK